MGKEKERKCKDFKLEDVLKMRLKITKKMRGLKLFLN